MPDGPCLAFPRGGGGQSAGRGGGGGGVRGGTGEGHYSADQGTGAMVGRRGMRGRRPKGGGILACAVSRPIMERETSLHLVSRSAILARVALRGRAHDANRRPLWRLGLASERRTHDRGRDRSWRLSVDGQDLFWLEARPNESGRTVLCRRRADGPIEDLTLAPFNVGSRVHEYGGGAYAVAAGVVIFSERTDGTVWMIEAGRPPRRIETPDGCRYADFEFDLPRRRVLAVREDHRDRPPTDPKAAIVALPLDLGGAKAVLVEGPGFLSSPRLSPRRRARLDRLDHPRMPWDGTELFVAGCAQEGPVKAAAARGGRNAGSNRATGVVHGGSPIFLFRPHRLVESYRLRGTRSKPWPRSKPRLADPHWVFRQRYYDFLARGTDCLRDCARGDPIPPP